MHNSNNQRGRNTASKQRYALPKLQLSSQTLDTTIASDDPRCDVIPLGTLADEIGSTGAALRQRIRTDKLKVGREVFKNGGRWYVSRRRFEQRMMGGAS